MVAAAAGEPFASYLQDGPDLQLRIGALDAIGQTSRNPETRIRRDYLPATERLLAWSVQTGLVRIGSDNRCDAAQLMRAFPGRRAGRPGRATRFEWWAPDRTHKQANIVAQLARTFLETRRGPNGAGAPGTLLWCKTQGWGLSQKAYKALRKSAITLAKRQATRADEASNIASWRSRGPSPRSRH